MITSKTMATGGGMNRKTQEKNYLGESILSWENYEIDKWRFPVVIVMKC